MPTYFIIIFSVIIYGALAWAVWKKRSLLNFCGFKLLQILNGADGSAGDFVIKI